MASRRTSTELQVIYEDSSRVLKKQKICSDETAATIKMVISQLETLKGRVERGEVSGHDNIKKEIDNLQEEIQKERLAKEMINVTRDFHAAIIRLGKSIDSYLLPDICKATRNLKMDHTALNSIIAEHLFKDGKFKVGDVFVRETGIEEPHEIKENFKVIHEIMKQILNKNLDPALQWAVENRSRLSKDNSPSKFEFQLHKLRYLDTLKRESEFAAMTYAKCHFQIFQETHLKEILKLLGMIAFHKRSTFKSRYASVETQFADTAEEFVRQACNLIGQPYRSPLLVAVSAGSYVLPQLLRLADVMETSRQDIKNCKQLPLEVELGKEFQFHSIFACPVSKDQSSSDNPPMLMPCGHVLCEQSIAKISKGRSRPFKCPYCPMEAIPVNCRKLIFPDILK